MCSSSLVFFSKIVNRGKLFLHSTPNLTRLERDLYGYFSPNEEKTGTLIFCLFSSEWSHPGPFFSLSYTSCYSLKSRSGLELKFFSLTFLRFPHLHSFALNRHNCLRSSLSLLVKPSMCLNRDYLDHFKPKSIQSMRFRRNGCRPVCVAIQS